MKQLRNFKGSNQNNGTYSEGSREELEPVLNEAMKKYDGMSEDALIETLINSVQESRRNGTYNHQEMTNYAAMLSPYLSESQREKLGNILSIISSEDGGY